MWVPERVSGQPGPKPLLLEDEIHAQPADLDDISVVEARGSLHGFAVYDGNFISRTEVVAIVALIDLRGDLRLEPAPQTHRCHFGFADHCELIGEHIFFLTAVAAEDR